MIVNNRKDNKFPRGMLTVSEVAEILHVHPNTIRAWSDSGLLKAYRVGYRHDRRFRLQDVDQFLTSTQKKSHLV